MRYAALTLRWSFPRAREGGALASGFDRRRRRRAIGSAAARPDRNRWPRVAVACVRSGISGWVGARRKARGQFLVAGAGRTSAAVTSIDRVR